MDADDPDGRPRRPEAWPPPGARRLVAAWLAVSVAGAIRAQALTIPVGPYEIDAEGKLEGRYVQEVEPSSPDEHPEGKLRLRLGSDLLSRLRFQTAFTGIAGGLPRDPDAAGVFNFDDTRQDLSPSLEIEEAYFDLHLPSLDTRIGLQKFAWGKLDAIQPNDYLNPEKFYDPLLEDEHDRKVGIPALAPTAYIPSPPGDWAPTELSVTGVWAPIVAPFHFPDQDERWYPPLARVPEESTAMGPFGEITVHNESRIRNGQVPSRDLRNGAGAARFAGQLRGADFALYFYDGYDVFPAFDVHAQGFARFDPTQPGLFVARSEIDIFPVFQRIRAVGVDLAYNFLGATIRAEGAYIRDRLYPKSINEVVASQEVEEPNPADFVTGEEVPIEVTLAPVNVKRDGVEWGFGGDYLYEDTFLLVQMNQTVVLDNEVDLLISDWETRIAMTVRRSFFGDRLAAELIGYYGMQGVYGLVHPRVTYDLTDNIDVRVGFAAIEGHENSLFGQYKHNDEGYVRLRYSF